MSKDNTKKISPAELSTFCGQVALILEAGLPLYDGMETLAGADSGSENAELYKAASDKVTETGSLYEALKDDGRWPEYLVEMVGVGERSGQLENIMRGLEKYYAREDRIRSSVSGAVTYPMVLGVMLVLIVLILLWKVLPVFRRVLNSMGVGLNDTGRALMHIGSVVGWVVLGVIALTIILGIVLLVLMRTGKREKVLDLIAGRFPAIARLSNKLAASRIAGILSMMLSGGFPTDEALEMTEKVIGDSKAAAKVKDIRKGLNDGKTLADSIEEAKIFDDLHNRMIKMGAATGREDQVLGKMAVLYEEQVEDDINRLISVIEPTLVALLAIVIGAVLLSVMLPMAGILSSL